MPVSAGELGTTAEAVEERLPRIFKRASRWKAVLLLDEADVLLEQRSVQDIHRNALVCVFLRTLEYYPGMMFLTTNRVRQIDDAIASRIHFKLKYDNLNLEQRTNIWRDFLERAATL
jgi:SpoVK/Ycf46/Vps4 family AAA+-type ATPase